MNNNQIKNRLKSIRTTAKITKAMEMIASAKLNSYRKRFEANKDYALFIEGVISKLLAVSDVESIYLKKNQSTKRAYIIFASDLGLCGAYNNNLLKEIEKLNKDDLLYIIGSRIGKKFKGTNIKEYHIDEITMQNLSDLTDELLNLYIADEIASISILYNRFISILKSETSIKTLIPYTASDKQAYKNVEFEPDPLTVLNKLIPQLMKALIYNAYLSAKSSEEAARKNAMNSATSNANELDEKLSLIYNKNRQSAITQEITEIVAGANAL